MSQMSKDITPSCPRSGTVPDCPVQGHVPSQSQHWTKVLKLRPEVKKKCGAVSTVTKISHNITRINLTLLKIYMRVVTNLLNNFT